MSKLIFQFHHPSGPVTVDEVARTYGFRPEEIDREYGVVQVSKERSLYAVRVEESTKDRVQQALKGKGEGPDTGFFSDPRIETFGPPAP